MAVTLKQGFGLVPNGVAISTANTNDTGDRALDAVTIGSGATLVADTSQLLHGKPMVKYQTGVSAAANGGWNSTSLNTALKTHYATFYIYIGAFGTNITCYRVTNAGTSNVIGSMILLTSRLLRWTNSASTTMVTTTIPIPLNTLTRVQAGILSDTTAGWAEISTFFTNPEGSVADETVRANNQATNSFAANTIRFGATNAAASNGPVWFGGFTASDTAYAGGVSAAPIAASGDMVSGSTFGGAGVRSTPIAATFVSGSALASTAPDRATPVAADMVSGSSFGGATPAVTVPEAATMTSGSVIAGTTPTLVEQAAATMVSGSVVTGSSARTTPLTGTAMVSGSQLTGSAAVSGKPTGSFLSGSKLLNTAGVALKVVSAGAMVSASAFSGASPARVQPAAGSMVSGSVFTGATPSLVITGAGAFTSGSNFGSASAATTSVTAVLLSGSLFGGSGLRTSPATIAMVSASSFNAAGALTARATAVMVSSTLFMGAGAISYFATMTSGSVLLTPIVEAGLKVVAQGILHDAVEADVIIDKQKHVAKVWVIKGGRKRPILDTVTNFIANSGSEVSMLGSEGAGAGVTTRVSDRVRFGSWATRHVWTSGSRGLSLTNGFLPLPAGTYSLTWWVFVENGPLPTWIATSNVYARPRQLGGPTQSGTWQECKATFDVTAAEGGVRIYNLQNAASQYVVDGIMLVEGSVSQPFSDGSFPGWQWTGTPGSSASVGFPFLLQNIAGLPDAWYDARYLLGKGNPLPTDGTSVATWKDLSGNGRDLVQATVNRRPFLRTVNPNMIAYEKATGLTGWAPQNDPGSTVVVTQGVTGRPGGLGSGVRAVCPGSLPYEGLTTPAGVTLQAGQTYTVSGWVYTSVAMTMRCQLLSTSGGGIAASAIPVPANTWTRVSATGAWNGANNQTDARIWFDTGPTNDGALTMTVTEVMVNIGGLPAAFSLPVPNLLGSSVVQFPGLPSNSMSTPFPNIRQGSIYSVYVPIQASLLTWQRLWNMGETSHDAWMVNRSNNTTAMGGRLDLNDSGGAYNFSLGSVNNGWDGGAYVHSAQLDLVGSTHRHRINGGADVTVALSQGPTPELSTVGGTFVLGAENPSLISYMEGAVAALLVYDQLHDTTTRKRIEQWLGYQYGIPVAP